MNNKYLITLLILGSIVLFANFQTIQNLIQDAAVPEEEFVNFESAHVHPIDMTPDGTKLLAVNTANNSLEVFTIANGDLQHTASIPVGVDPITVRVRSNQEAWVANLISDDISIVDLDQNVVIRSLQTENEPSDIVFAGSPLKAFVSCAERESIQIFNLSNLDAAPQEVLLIGEQPRAMAVSPDGNTVYTAFFESGNQTTVIPGNLSAQIGLTSPQGGSTVIQNDVANANGPYGGTLPVPNNGNGFSPPMNPDLFPETNNQSLVVRKNAQGQWMDDNGGDWTSIVSGGQGIRVNGWDMQDRDVAVLNANSLGLSYQKHLGNILMAIATNPVTGKVSVVGTDATNHIRFTPNLNGTFLRVNISQFTPGSATNDITDLNNHLTYTTSSVAPSERQKSIGDPRGIAWKADGTTAYVTGMGSNNVIRINSNGDRVGTQPIVVGEGPTGIVLDETRNQAYVLNKFDGSISIIDINNNQEVIRKGFYDPTPQAIKTGRKHLYDTHQGSGLGHISCASCHVDGKWDRLAWDLGDPSGEMENVNGRLFHPMKGLKVTQQLIDIIGKGDGLLHWRGDKQTFAEFASAFNHLQGTDNPLNAQGMAEFEAFLANTYHPPSPYRPFRPVTDLATGRMNPNKVRGPGTSFQQIQNVGPIFNTMDQNCNNCHLAHTGRGPANYEANENISADLRTTYRKLGFYYTSTESTAGFGMLSDGIMETWFNQEGIEDYLGDYQQEVLGWTGGVDFTNNPGSADFDGVHESQDSHAAVGLQATRNGNVGTDAAVNTLRNMVNDFPDELGLIVKGIFQGEKRGFVYLGNNNYQSDQAGQTATHAQLLAAGASGEPLTWTIVHGQTAIRAGIDNNSNGIFDYDEDCGDTLGQACEDGDPCTTGETIDADCNCTGGVASGDTDNDGVCDAEDVCPGFDDNLIGATCDDGDDCTTGEVFDNNCNCAGGVFTDNDGDGICIGDDPDDTNGCVPNPGSGACNPCSIIATNDFETNLGIWNDGGSDCARVTSATFANSGSGVVRLRDNSGIASSMYTDPIDVSEATEVKLSFSFVANSMETNEDFFVEASANGGANYTLVQEWNSGAEFTNGVRQNVTVNIPSSSFSTNTVLRIRCDASANGDQVYIDDASIEVCIPITCIDGTPCDDNNVCTTGETLDSDCNCAGGTVTDADNDGYCLGEDPDDNNPCIPDANHPNCQPGGCITVDSENFENGLGIWVDLGAAASVSTEASFANSGTQSILIVNDGAASTATSTSFDWSSMANLEVEFSFITNSFEGVEDFWLQISMDGGSSFTTVKEWVLGIDFQNNVRKNELVTIVGPFSANTKLRFRGDASADSDYLYLDDIVVRACTPDNDNQAPTAAISADPLSGTAPMIVTFDGNGSTDPDGDPLNYSWNFGDGNTATGPMHSYTYQNAGTYTATLTVSDGALSDQASVTISVEDGDGCTTLDSESFENGNGIWSLGDAASLVDNPLFANSGNYSLRIVNDGKQSVATSNNYDLTGFSSLDVNFSFQTESFEAGEDFWLQLSTDGGSTFTTVKEWVVETDFANSVRQNESVTINGPFTTTTKVRFRCDATADTDFLYLDDVILIACAPDGNNQAPIASFTATPTSGPAPLNVSFDASNSVDLDGDALSYFWTFGDGTTASGQQVNHIYQNAGGYTATLTVSDGQATDQISTTITADPGSGCTSVVSENFESGPGIWSLGNAASYLNNPQLANSGNYTLLIVNDGSQSVATSSNLNLSTYGSIEVSFSFITNSFELGEDFWLQVSTDGGSTFSTVEDWIVETDFVNGIRQNPTVLITGSFTNSTQIRFRCDASADSDYLYIDDINIIGCTNLGLTTPLGNPQAQNQEATDVVLNLFPNPTQRELNVTINKVVTGELRIYNLQGKLFNRYILEDSYKEQLDIHTLPGGTYFLQYVGKDGEIRQEKFIKLE